ncbi:hypothetical protein J6590_104222 [Homalodisca vitripennis]|nr:hypothetical protein J6590_104222 [Homalodisca vitripennis]
MSEGKQLSKTNKHLIKQNIKLELLLTCTPRLGVLTPLSRKGQMPSNEFDVSEGKVEKHVYCNRGSDTRRFNRSISSDHVSKDGELSLYTPVSIADCDG